MKTVQVKVTHYYNHVVLYPFMSQIIFDILEDAFLHDKLKAEVPKYEYDQMIREFLHSLRN